MLSPVRHNTQSAIRHAKRMTPRRGNSQNLGIVIKKSVKDIQTDSLVDKTVMGRPWGEDPAYDYNMILLAGVGIIALLSNRNIHTGKLPWSDPVLVTGIGWGLFHLIPWEINLRR